jgi:capsular polysaccharide biosynthesis protein
VAPWSHKWATYYEFVVHILGKLCRIKQAIDPSLWAAAKVCYPLRRAPFEQQYLSLLGLDESALVDTRHHAVVPRSLVISNLQSRDHLATPTTLASLRDTFLAGVRPPEDGGRRLYLSRVGWKRQVINESEVRDVVSSYGLEIIESIPVSVEEQIRLFNSASLVVSPHGSALANLVWCSPGTRVIELFSRSFVSDVYAGICHVLGLRHTYLLDEATEPHHWTNLHKDLTVDIRSLVTALEEAMA